jgi:L-ascorbate metabolism protein UlaG (beta-lactamase superfamily)
MKITYYGHACFLIETQGKKLLFDPFISENPLAKKIDINKIEADYILLTHGHQNMFWTLNKSLKIQEQHSFLTLKLSAGLETKESRDTE